MITTCQSGRAIIKNRKGVDMYVIRLNLVDTDAKTKTKYRTKEISTGLKATKRNLVKVNAMIAEEIAKYGTINDNLYFHVYSRQWLDHKKIEIELVTYEGYEYRLRHIEAYFSEHPVLVKDVSAEHADAFYRYLLTKERSCSVQRSDQGLSNRTIKDIAFLFRSILSDALALGLASKRERTLGAINRKIPKKPEDIAEKAYIGVDEVEAFRNAIKGHPLEIPFQLALFYGLRREEILGLKWSAIRNGRLYVEHTVSRMKTTVAKNRTKTSASHRDYPIPPEIMDALEKLKQEQHRNRLLLGESYQKSDYVFTWPDGRPFSPDYLTKSFKKLVRKNDQLDNSLTLHSLRASCVSILIHAGTDIKDVQAWVGHKDVQTTLNIYARTNEKQQTKVMNLLSDTVFCA